LHKEKWVFWEINTSRNEKEVIDILLSQSAVAFDTHDQSSNVVRRHAVERYSFTVSSLGVAVALFISINYMESNGYNQPLNNNTDGHSSSISSNAHQQRNNYTGASIGSYHQHMLRTNRQKAYERFAIA